MAIKVGITGGIGSGKTTAARLFEQLGVPVYYADDAAKWLMQHDADLRQSIQHAFGESIYDSNGNLDRASLAQIVFANPNRLRQLEALVHPAVARHTEQWIQRQNAPYLLKEAALLLESGAARKMDKIIVVTAPESLRIARVQQRDGLPESAIRQRIAQQMPESERLPFADYVLYNDGEQLLIPQVLAIHKSLLQIAENNEFKLSLK